MILDNLILEKAEKNLLQGVEKYYSYAKVREIISRLERTRYRSNISGKIIK